MLAAWARRAVIALSGLALAGAAALAVLTGRAWSRYRTHERAIVEKMDRYWLNLTVPGREEYLLESDEVFVVPYMASKLSVDAVPTRILDASDRLIAEFSTERGLYARSPEELPAYLKKALVASEDGRFYSHRGVDWKATARAVAVTLTGARRRQGGSTLTQQLAKQMFTTSERTADRKLFEFFCARKLEEKFTKDQILLMYLNFAYFGHGTFGVESASRYYFGKPASALEIGEAALLVGLIPNPYKYSPLDHPELARARVRTVLRRMVKDGYLADTALERVERDLWDGFARRGGASEVSFWRTRINESPYLTEFVRRRMLQHYTKERLLRGGLVVRTTFDLDAQRAAQESLRRALARENDPSAAADEDGEPAGKRAPVEGALVALRPQDGALLALVGGSGFSFSNQFDRAADGRRLVGSAVKPFIWAAAFESGRHKPDDLFVDERVTYKVGGGRRWSPRNYGDKYYGEVRLDFALHKSLNTVAVKLLKDLDLDAVIGALSMAFGIPRERWPRNLSLALGTADASPLQVAAAYAVFANGGRAVTPYWLRSVHDRDGEALMEPAKAAEAAAAAPSVVFSSETARMTVEVMKGVLGPDGTAHSSVKKTGFAVPAAGKTGTTNDYRDAWFAGVTADLSAAVWVGHDDMRHAMPPGKAGGSVSAPIGMGFMKQVYLSRPAKPL
ncbi:MAG: transglycosylase domain-containing protein [Elusimicrobiota bacterium]|nr:transglycosylase domain-containing protein [Elusimicrobiota bacterium]